MRKLGYAVVGAAVIVAAAATDALASAVALPAPEINPGTLAGGLGLLAGGLLLLRARFKK
jgi:hypothetical protein